MARKLSVTIKQCKHCGEDFTSHTSSTICSDECRKDRYKPIKDKCNRNLSNKTKKYSEKWGISISVINRYTIPFLEENPEVLKVLQVSNLLTGRTNVPSEIKEIRSKVSRNTNPKKYYNYVKKELVPINCKVCEEEFTPSNIRNVCCSDECRLKNRRSIMNKSQKKYYKKILESKK